MASKFQELRDELHQDPEHRRRGEELKKAYDKMLHATSEGDPYPGMPRYSGDVIDAYTHRPWGWSDPVMQSRYFEEKKKLDRVSNFVRNLQK